MLRQLTGRNERCLILGAGILEGMSLGPFRAILAHEYGHLSNQDTAGGGFALAVRRSLHTMAENLAARGAAGWYNPAWLFLNGFYSIFLRISQGASRLQEVLADRWAALSYGAQAFEEGLRHAITQSIRFEAHARLHSTKL
jgi:Zn-dependent protease with chaperone function